MGKLPLPKEVHNSGAQRQNSKNSLDVEQANMSDDQDNSFETFRDGPNKGTDTQ